MTAALALVAAAASETGLVRQNNEDAAYSGHWLFAVADGMGGHAAGEVASAVVIESLRAHDDDVGAGALLEVLGQAVAEANAEVARRAAEDSSRFGMGPRSRRCSGQATQLASPLMKRRYDLRHSGITWRLNSGIPATDVAAWAGHSLEVLTRVYARCVVGLNGVWIGRMDEALDLGRTDDLGRRRRHLTASAGIPCLRMTFV